MKRVYKNLAEESFCNFIEKRGFTPIKRGWPDFFCKDKNGKVIAVEVKPNSYTHMTPYQYIVNSTLASFGIEVFLFDARKQELIPIKSTDTATAIPL